MGCDMTLLYKNNFYITAIRCSLAVSTHATAHSGITILLDPISPHHCLLKTKKNYTCTQHLLVLLILVLLFSRASAEFRTVTERLSAESRYAGADWLLHSHGGILHERVRQQGAPHIHSIISCCHV